MREILAVGIGGFVGAIARHLVSSTLTRRFGADFPVGTIAVNVLGCFALGALVAVFQARAPVAPATRALLAVGLLGSFTTYSTFGHETWALVRQGAWVGATANVVLSLVLGVAAVASGLYVGERWAG